MLAIAALSLSLRSTVWIGLPLSEQGFCGGSLFEDNFFLGLNSANSNNSDAVANRFSNLPHLKINKIKFVPGSEVTFTFEQEIYRSGNCRLIGGLGRLIVIPMRGEDSTTLFNGFGNYGKVAGDTYYNADGQSDFDNEYPPITPEELNNEAATLIQQQIEQATGEINNALPYVNSTTETQLLDLRDQIYATRDQPGTYTDVTAYLIPLINQVNTILGYKFRFQT